MSKPNPKVIRPGDKVRIISPRFVKRWGYPKCIDDYLDRVQEEMSPVLLEKFGIGKGLGTALKPLPLWRKHAIFRAIAAELLIKDGFGGKHRTLHFMELPELVGQEHWVCRRRRVLEGWYNGGYWSGGYESPPEWEQSYLSVEKVHNLVQIGPVDRKTGPFTTTVERLWIQPECVEKVHGVQGLTPVFR